MSGADDLARLTVTIDKANELFLSEEPKMVDVGGGVMRPTNAKVLADLATQMNGAQIYTSVALGLASTAQDSYFSVPSSEAREYLILYQNSAGAAREVDRYPSILAVDDVLGLISPSNNSPHIGASVTDADGFELLQIHTDGLMKSAAFEIDKTGVQTERLALQSLDLPHVDSSISIMDADGFHFPLDIKYPGVSPASPVSTLAELRDSLANELEDICIRVCADSIGWGMTVIGGGAIDPRSHALTDARNNLTSPTWANLLHQYLGNRYSTGSMISPGPGIARYAANHTIDIASSQKVYVVDILSQTVKNKLVSSDAKAALKALCIVPDAHALRFDTVGSELTLVYQESASSGSFVILVDGVVNTSISANSSVTAYGKTVKLTFPFGRHSVEVRCTGQVSFETIQKNRQIRFANDGLIGTNTQEWLPTGKLLPASVAIDDTHVFVQLGTNDRSLTTEPNDPVRTKRNLKEIADYITRVRGKKLVMMAANFADDDYPSLGSAKYSQADVARIVAQVSAEVGCGHIDNYSATLKQKLAGESFLADRLHPNDSGHMRIFNNITENLERA